MQYFFSIINESSSINFLPQISLQEIYLSITAMQIRVALMQLSEDKC